MDVSDLEKDGRTRDALRHILTSLCTSDASLQLQLGNQLLSLCRDPSTQGLIGELGTFDYLIAFLNSEIMQPIVGVALEATAFATVGNLANKDILRKSGGIDSIVKLLHAQEPHISYRALLVIRVFTEREVDRQTVRLCGALEKLVEMLRSTKTEIVENAAGAIGNLAAGSQILKEELRLSGAIKPLVELLAGDEIVAEFAAVALRNLSVRNPKNRQEIMRCGGLEPLVRLLANGQDCLHECWDCVAEFEDGATKAGVCFFDVSQGWLTFRPQPSDPSAPSDPGSKVSAAEGPTYSLMDRFKISELGSDTLELRFGGRKQSIAPCGGPRSPPPLSGCCPARLSRMVVSPCPVAELKGAILRMMTRVHLEQEFRSGSRPRGNPERARPATARLPSPLSSRLQRRSTVSAHRPAARSSLSALPARAALALGSEPAPLESAGDTSEPRIAAPLASATAWSPSARSRGPTDGGAKPSEQPSPPSAAPDGLRENYSPDSQRSPPSLFTWHSGRGVDSPKSHYRGAKENAAPEGLWRVTIVPALASPRP
mmetsp:Transcript_8800/g.21259  ORF Transcript_8800/g.21259 Transcript_8800/m.21259 type:complete len:543 (+) Transcript_8800:490-2118(+)